MAPGRVRGKSRLFNSPMAVPDPGSDTRESPAPVAELRAGSVLPFWCSPAVNGPCAPPAEFSAGCRCTVVRAAFDRLFESRQLQFHNTAFSKAPGGLIGIQPKTEHVITDGSARPEDIRFEHQFGPCGIENLLRGTGHSVNHKVFVHDQEDVKISGRRLRGDKTTPDEDAA